MVMGNTNFQTIYPMGGIVNGMVKQATGREPVDNLDMDYVTVAQNTVVGELEFTGDVVQFQTGRSVPIRKLEVSLEPVQSGSGDPSPSNVRPISGWTGANVVRTGKNLLAKPFSYRPVPSSLSDCFFAKAGTYTFSFDAIGTATSWRFGISMFDANGNALTDSSYKPGTSFTFANSVQMWYQGQDVTDKSHTFTLPTDCFIRIWFGSGNTSDSMEATKAQLELGSTATDYEPYTGETITTEFPTPPGTVYGGTLDVVSGKLTVDRVSIELDGSIDEGWTIYNPSNYDSYCFVIDTPLKSLKKLTSICDKYKNVNDAWGAGGNGKYGVFSDHGTVKRIYFTRPNSSFEKSLTAWKAWIAEEPLQVVYELATPQTYQLTPQEVSTLVGDNTIYSDAGAVDVMYWVYREMS